MSSGKTTPRALILVLCAVLFGAVFIAPAEAKRHSRHGHHKRHHKHKAHKNRHRSTGSTTITTTSHQTAVVVCPGANALPTAATTGAAEAATLCLVNNERLKQGLHPLGDNLRLHTAALAHSTDMTVHNYFDHTSPTGSTLLSRITLSGYASPNTAWVAGENIAWGTGPLATPDSIVRAWMNSPGHRQNILRADFREVGTGVSPAVPVSGGDAGATYTQDFGAHG